MSDQHLGDEIHELLDNRLTPARASVAMAHLDACDDCRARWDELRAARDALQSSSAGIDMRFAQQLLDRDRIAQIAKGESKDAARAASGPRRRPVLVLVVVLTVLGVGVGVAYYAGEPEEVSLEFAEAGVGAQVAVVSTGAQAMRAGDQLRSWVHPDWESTGLVPVGAKVVRSRTGENVLVASVLANLEPIVITEQHGRLSPQFADFYSSIDLGHTHAYLIDESPRQLVWQTGDVVISLTCSCALTTLEAVASTFPAQGSPGFIDRVADGFGELTGIASDE